MKRTLITIISTILFFLPLPVLANTTDTTEEITLDRLILNNFIETNCQFFKTPKSWKVFDLYEGYVNMVGSRVAPKSCKGQVYWSWQTPFAGADFFTWQLYDSTLPLSIRNIEKISKSISQTIKQTESLRKSSSSLVDAVQEFIKSSFSSSKERATTKERTMTESKTQEQAVETNITPAFHKFMGMALQGPFITHYNFCLSSAVDLFFKAYDSDRVNDLVEAFVVYKTIKPEDLEFSSSKTMLNRAKLLYSIHDANDERAKHVWAQATLFAKLLEWQEFEKIRNITDSYIDKVYATYQMLKRNTTKDILQNDKLLAAIKYTTDKKLTSQQNIENAKIEDKYTTVAAYYHYKNKDENKVAEIQKQLDTAIQNNDELLTKKLVKSEVNKNIQKYAIFATIIAIIVAVTATIIKKKRKQS